MAFEIATEPTLPRSQHRFTLEQYHSMFELGVLTTQDRCELIRGFIVEMPAINPPYASAIRRLMKHLIKLLGTEAGIRVQLPITLYPDSEPEPDLVIARGSDSDYDDHHPEAGEIDLVIEISDTTLTYDRTIQLSLYAAAKLPVYWIVNLVDRQVEVYTQPRGGKNPGYRSRKVYSIKDSTPVILGGKPMGSIPVREILPR